MMNSRFFQHLVIISVLMSEFTGSDTTEVTQQLDYDDNDSNLLWI